jgi:diamine N-acetyltransferase
MIKLKDIDADNFWEVIKLSVAEHQKGFVATNTLSIAQSKVQLECIPLAVYEDETLVGFVMY